MKIFLCTVIVLFLILIIWSIFEQRFFKTTYYKINHDNYNNKNPISFVVLSDLHNFSFGKNNIKLIRKIDQLNPDFILIAGDMVTKNKPCIPSNAYNLLKQLSKKYKIYYGYGNHEQRFEKLAKDKSPTSIKLYNSWKSYKTALLDLGVVFLDNMSLSYVNNLDNLKYKNIKITGLTIDLKYFKPGMSGILEDNYLNNLIGKKDESTFDILIAHNPLYFHDYAKWGSDIVISGHVHGGIIRLPFLNGVLSPQLKLFPKYDGGEYNIGNSTMLLSKGLGTHSLIPRINNKPELLNVTIQCK